MKFLSFTVSSDCQHQKATTSCLQFLFVEVEGSGREDEVTACGE